MAEIERLEHLGVIDGQMLIVHSGWLEPQEVAILAPAQAVAGLRSEFKPAQWLWQFRHGQAAGADVARRQRGARLRIMQVPASSISCRKCGWPVAATRKSRANPRVMPPETGIGDGDDQRRQNHAMGRQIGSIETGKDADIVLFDTDRPEWQPLINPVANLVYSATGDSVRHVFVAGEQVVKDGRCTRIDESGAVRADSARRRTLLAALAHERNRPASLAGRHDVYPAEIFSARHDGWRATAYSPRRQSRRRPALPQQRKWLCRSTAIACSGSRCWPNSN